MKKNKLITHNGSFHADDIFAAAALSLYLEKKGEDFEIIRTRDQEIIKSGDYVFDVGGVYDPEQNKFDHHQKGGAGRRDNGIEYAAFGLVWNKFGLDVSGDEKVFDIIDKKLVTSIDAFDNGFDLYKSNFKDVAPYTIGDVLSIFSKTALEDFNKDQQFFKALVWAKEILSREIKRNSDEIKIAKIIQDFYKNSSDKRIVIISAPKVSRYEVWDALQEFPEVLFAVYGDNDDWAAVAMKTEKSVFKNRKDFPQAWGGLTNDEFRKVTGVADSIFCHRSLFLVGAKTMEGAIKLAQIAVESKE